MNKKIIGLVVVVLFLMGVEVVVADDKTTFNSQNTGAFDWETGDINTVPYSTQPNLLQNVPVSRINAVSEIDILNHADQLSDDQLAQIDTAHTSFFTGDTLSKKTNGGSLIGAKLSKSQIQSLNPTKIADGGVLVTKSAADDQTILAQMSKDQKTQLKYGQLVQYTAKTEGTLPGYLADYNKDEISKYGENIHGFKTFSAEGNVQLKNGDLIIGDGATTTTFDLSQFGTAADKQISGQRVEIKMEDGKPTLYFNTQKIDVGGATISAQGLPSKQTGGNVRLSIVPDKVNFFVSKQSPTQPGDILVRDTASRALYDPIFRFNSQTQKYDSINFPDSYPGGLTQEQLDQVSKNYAIGRVSANGKIDEVNNRYAGELASHSINGNVKDISVTFSGGDIKSIGAQGSDVTLSKSEAPVSPSSYNLNVKNGKAFVIYGDDGTIKYGVQKVEGITTEQNKLSGLINTKIESPTPGQEYNFYAENKGEVVMKTGADGKLLSPATKLPVQAERPSIDAETKLKLFKGHNDAVKVAVMKNGNYVSQFGIFKPVYDEKDVFQGWNRVSSSGKVDSKLIPQEKIDSLIVSSLKPKQTVTSTSVAIRPAELIAAKSDQTQKVDGMKWNPAAKKGEKTGFWVPTDSKTSNDQTKWKTTDQMIDAAKPKVTPPKTEKPKPLTTEKPKPQETRKGFTPEQIKINEKLNLADQKYDELTAKITERNKQLKALEPFLIGSGRTLNEEERNFEKNRATYLKLAQEKNQYSAEAQKVQEEIAELSKKLPRGTNLVAATKQVRRNVQKMCDTIFGPNKAVVESTLDLSEENKVATKK